MENVHFLKTVLFGLRVSSTARSKPRRIQLDDITKWTAGS